MATLPPSTDITSSTATEGNAKTWFSSVRTYIAQQLGANGTQAESLTTLGAPFNGALTKTGAYTVVAADRGKSIKCSGTFTLSLSAVASLGDGFMVGIVNDGAGIITIDPNLSETIDSSTTLSLAAGKSLVIYCDGSKWVTFGRGGVDSINGQVGSVVDTALYAIGSFVIGRPANATNYAVNDTIAGSSLYVTGMTGLNASGTSAALVWVTSAWNTGANQVLINTGSWRCVSPAWGDGSANGKPGLWVRYA